MEYGSMGTKIARFLDRADLTTDINGWINDTRYAIAVEALAAGREFAYLYTEATALTSAGSAVYALPDDYLGHLDLMCGVKKLAHVGAREFDDLKYHAYAGSATGVSIADGVFLPTTNAADLATTGEPDYYCDRGMEFELYPEPNGEYTLTIKYYAFPSAFSASDDEDYLMKFHPDAVVFGAVIRGAMFLDDQAKLAIFMPMYEKEMGKIVRKEKQKETTDMPIRMKTYKDYTLLEFKKKFRVV